jgi:hypothetical protein
MKTYSEILEEKDKEGGGYGIFLPPITGQEAVNILTDYLLGEDWYTANPVSQDQVNAEIVADILWKYSSKYRKEVKSYNKKSIAQFIRNLLPFKVWYALYGSKLD